ncbi:glutamate racemase [sulfur-oxidizing endosymbiont of Gigantopelta aegis]|uniref:glutamate racemase n=1 Tax=sulfur-oxidizing endosymbiont of Gigantopelta aegis TaxID=2794934 RepID=UPI0018DCE85E|nr:glutamate racemase [sulfur-oxidizing endosymbiont of Gigantopelta aegis]
MSLFTASSKVSAQAKPPIGIFDSGVGGLSVLQHIQQLSPSENIIYVADSGHAPYGCKAEVFIEQRSRIITEYLLSQGAKAIVIACNTATASIIERFRQDYGIPFIGVEPGIKPAIAVTKNNTIGVMATAATLASERYQELTQRYASDVNLINQSCPGLADQVEAGLLDSHETITLLKQYLASLLAQQVDTIVLGCTHYSFLQAQIRNIVGQEIHLVDPSLAIAEQLERVLLQLDVASDTGQALHESKGQTSYYSSGSVKDFQNTMMHLLKQNIVVEPLSHTL